MHRLRRYRESLAPIVRGHWRRKETVRGDATRCRAGMGAAEASTCISSTSSVGVGERKASQARRASPSSASFSARRVGWSAASLLRRQPARILSRSNQAELRSVQVLRGKPVKNLDKLQFDRRGRVQTTALLLRVLRGRESSRARGPVRARPHRLPILADRSGRRCIGRGPVATHRDSTSGTGPSCKAPFQVMRSPPKRVWAS